MNIAEKTKVIFKARNLLFASFLFCFISACKQPRKSIAQPASLPHEIKFSDSENPLDAPILILLHGYGSHEKDLFSFSNYLNSSINIICPRARVQLQGGGYAWYDIEIGSGKTKYNFENVKKAKTDIITFIKEVKAQHHLKSNKIYLGGFSQGAIMSLYVGLTEPNLVEGLIVLSGHLYPEVKQEINLSASKSFPKIFLSHGRKDNVLSFELAEEAVQFLEQNNVTIDEHWYDSSHTISRENLNDMLFWLDQSLKH